MPGKGIDMKPIEDVREISALTYGFIAWPDRGFGSPVVWGSLLAGVVGLVAFVVVESRSPSPMLPLEVFRSRLFTATNVVTFAVYAALSGVFFVLVVALQVVAGFSPIASGAALLPVTIIMLFLAARGGALGQRIGPRIPMTVGPLVSALGVLSLARIGPDEIVWRSVDRVVGGEPLPDTIPVKLARVRDPK